MRPQINNLFVPIKINSRINIGRLKYETAKKLVSGPELNTKTTIPIYEILYHLYFSRVSERFIYIDQIWLLVKISIKFNDVKYSFYFLSLLIIWMSETLIKTPLLHRLRGIII